MTIKYSKLPLRFALSVYELPIWYALFSLNHFIFFYFNVLNFNKFILNYPEKSYEITNSVSNLIKYVTVYN